MKKDWIESELERSLRRVGAPEELRNRVYHPQPRRAGIVWWKPAFALVLFVATVWAGRHPGSFNSESALFPAPVRLCGENPAAPQEAFILARAERATRHPATRATWTPRAESCQLCHVEPLLN